jgi:hypothetical protein
MYVKHIILCSVKSSIFYYFIRNKMLIKSSMKCLHLYELRLRTLMLTVIGGVRYLH